MRNPNITFQEMVDPLPDDYKTVLIKRLIEGKTFDELSFEIGKTRNDIYKIQMRAFRQLAEIAKKERIASKNR